jgi:predicted acylesterase/phospholipase RssA
LPPFFDAAGHMLVDGGVMDNVPVTAMNSLKSGPNLIVDLRPREHCFFDFSYDSIPGRRALLARAFNSLSGGKRLPACPGPAGVIQRSIFGKRPDQPDSDNPLALVLRPPAFKGSNFMNWDRHADVLDASYEWALTMIEKLRAQSDPALAAMLRLSDRDASSGGRSAP